MSKEKTKSCKYCGNHFERITYSNTEYCSYWCRFLELAIKFNGISSCWEWPISRNVENGYGQFTARVNGKTRVFIAHRLSYEAFVGEIPQGMFVLHKCDNRKCFNPAHLFLGSQDDNMKDMVSKGRSAKRAKLAKRGDNHWTKVKPEKVRVGTQLYNAQLTEDAVRDIRSSSERSADLARKYKVSPQVLCSARKGHTWKHVK